MEGTNNRTVVEEIAHGGVGKLTNLQIQAQNSGVLKCFYAAA